MTIPRIVIAATGSGVGKTTVTVGLIAALRARGLRVAPFKCGPDYLDPSYHARAAARPSPNLDGWMMGRRGVLETFASAEGADVAVIEGMMGLFDSAAPRSDEGSTAEIARWLDAPIVLVADASGIARTIGAIALGFARFDPALRLSGIICNNVGGGGHLDLLREASPEVPIVGGLPKRPELAVPERHLGLPAATEANLSDDRLRAFGSYAAEWLALDQILDLARSAPALDAAPERRLPAARRRCRIGLAYDEAFHFYYEYNLAMLERLGAELVRFSPIHDRELPQVDGLYLGGGYPEAAALELSANQSMRDAVRGFASAGGAIYAECGGLMYLTEGIRLSEDAAYSMVGLIPGVAVMSDHLEAIGYAEVTTTAASWLGPAGTCWRGHQFRYSTLAPAPPDTFERIYRVAPRWGGAAYPEGFRRGNLIASYVHAHWASNPDLAENFVRMCSQCAVATPR